MTAAVLLIRRIEGRCSSLHDWR